MALGRLKHGRGPNMVVALAAPVLVLLACRLCSVAMIQSCYAEIESLALADQLLMSRYLFEASLIGYSLFLALIIARMHHCSNESQESMQALKNQSRALEDARSVEKITHNKEIARLNEEIKLLKLESETRVNEAKKTAAANVKKQSEGFLLEYNRLLDDNHSLQNQLKLMNCIFSHSRRNEGEATSVEKITHNKEMGSLNEQTKLLNLESETWVMEEKAAAANAIALKKQSEGLLLEYDRLLHQNHSLRNQLKLIDLTFSHSHCKKNS